jgi:hypothetical protein
MLNRKGERVHTLFIESEKVSHVVNYTCLAKNKAGTVEFTSHFAPK